MASESPIALEHVSHSFGDGALRRRVLHDVSLEIRRGELVILTGPSGSGKTTLLTLIGALRSSQEGSVRVLGRELRGASQRELARVRRRMGYVFQAHNLVDALTATQNVQMSLAVQPEISAREARARADEILGAVGLETKRAALPDHLSGGQKQRVAIARALAGRPEILLADEPTASLDRKSGREVIELVQDLVRRQACTALVVTHDERILDVADRIIHLDDGELVSFSDAVLGSTRKLLETFARNNRKGELARELATLPPEHFARLFGRVTSEFQAFLDVVDLSRQEAFESMLEQIIEAFTLKVGEILEADRATLFLVFAERGELRSKVAQGDARQAIDIRVPIGSGIAGDVAATGRSANVADAYADSRFDARVDRSTGYRTKSVLCVPIADRGGKTFAVAQLLNKRGGGAFTDEDLARFQQFASSIGAVLEAWWRMSVS